MKLSKFDNSWYRLNGNSLLRISWYFTNAIFFLNPLFPLSSVKIRVLRLFGAKVGKGVRIKPSVNIKYPWNLKIGDYVWIGEKVWIDNLAKVTIGNNVCISQGAMLLCGNHNYKKETFDLMIGEITLEDSTWVGAQSTVCPGVTLRRHSILTVGSILNKDTEEYGIYQGNPAVKVHTRCYEENTKISR